MVHTQIKLFFDPLPDPATLLQTGRINFQKRNAVPKVCTGDLLARCLLPAAGKPGTGIEGQKSSPSPVSPGKLLTGANVTVQEADGTRFFFATGPGWARVIKNRLSVLPCYRHDGDVDYRVGNLQVEGDVEIKGTVKGRSRVRATGNVYVDGTLEWNSEVDAGGDVVVEGGINGAKVRSGGDLCARFIQDSNIRTGQDLTVCNYIRDSHVQVQRKAIIKGDLADERHLCLQGGTLLAGLQVDAASMGSVHRRRTVVRAGVSPELEARLEKYRRGLSFADLQIRRSLRALERVLGKTNWQANPIAAVRRAPSECRAFLIRHLHQTRTMNTLKVSLEHHIEKLGAQRHAAAGQARIRALVTAFSNVTVQIGEAYQILDEEIQQATFRLNPEGTQVVTSQK